MRTVERDGYRCWMFLWALWRLKVLKAFEASTMIVASTSGVSSSSRMACPEASHSASCPAHSWSGPATAWISSFKVVRMALLMMLRAVSPIPMGLTPGHLSRAIRRQAVKAVRPLDLHKINRSIWQWRPRHHIGMPKGKQTRSRDDSMQLHPSQMAQQHHLFWGLSHELSVHLSAQTGWSVVL